MMTSKDRSQGTGMEESWILLRNGNATSLDNARNIRSILKKLTVLSPVTNSVAKMMTASGGHGNMIIRSAVSLPIALTRSKVQDIQMPEPAQTASVDSKHVLGESVIALTNVRGMWFMGIPQTKQDTLRTASISAKTQWTASGILMRRTMTTVCYSRIATPQLPATHVPLGKNTAPMDTMEMTRKSQRQSQKQSQRQSPERTMVASSATCARDTKLE